MLQVIWEYTSEATDPMEAAREALAAQQRRGSIANVFDVYDEQGRCFRVDLWADTIHWVVNNELVPLDRREDEHVPTPVPDGPLG